MEVAEFLRLLASILAGIAACIPLAVELTKWVKAAVKEKNWNKVLSLVMDLMEQAEGKFETGAERKEWVLVNLKAMSDTIDYDIDYNAISSMIDSLIKLTKTVNIEDVVADKTKKAGK